MPGNPNADLGALDRASADVVFSNNPTLDVTVDMLTPSMVSMEPQNGLNSPIDVPLGHVPSAELALRWLITININRAMPIFYTFRNFYRLGTQVGPVTIYRDVPGATPYKLQNGILMTAPRESLDGGNASAVIQIRATEIINSNSF